MKMIIVTIVILTLLVVIIGIWCFKIKQREKVRQKKREELLSLAVQLLDVQLDYAEIKSEENFYIIEIAKYLKDYVLEQMVEGDYDRSGAWCAHGYIVDKYPEIFRIFDEVHWSE